MALQEVCRRPHHADTLRAIEVPQELVQHVVRIGAKGARTLFDVVMQMSSGPIGLAQGVWTNEPIKYPHLVATSRAVVAFAVFTATLAPTIPPAIRDTMIRYGPCVPYPQRYNVTVTPRTAQQHEHACFVRRHQKTIINQLALPTEVMRTRFAYEMCFALETRASIVLSTSNGTGCAHIALTRDSKQTISIMANGTIVAHFDVPRMLILWYPAALTYLGNSSISVLETIRTMFTSNLH